MKKLTKTYDRTKNRANSTYLRSERRILRLLNDELFSFKVEKLNKQTRMKAYLISKILLNNMFYENINLKKYKNKSLSPQIAVKSRNRY